MDATAELNALKERLAAAEAKAAILELLPTPVMQLDAAGTIIYLNPAGAAVLGLSRQHAAGLHCHNVLQTPLCRTGACLCQQAITANTNIAGETVVDPSGLNIPIRFTGTPLPDAAGKPGGAVITLIDLRSEVELAAEVLRLQIALTQGDLNVRGAAEKFTGRAQEMLQGVNGALDAVIAPLKLATAHVGRIAQGELPAMITAEFPGELNELNRHFNQWREVCQALLADVTELRQAAARGQLAARADLAKYQGVWATLLNGVNETVATMRAPIREIGNVLDKMAAGDLKARVTTAYPGDYQVLPAACQELGRQVLGVREAFTGLQTALGNGQLAARCNPYEFKGEFAAIAQSGNDMLDAVSSPLKLVMEYVAQIAQGKLPPKIIDAYPGDFNGLKLNLNSLLDTLQGLTNAADAIANGDLAVQLPKRAEEDRLIRAFQQMVGNFRQFTAEMDNLTETASAGRLDVRGNVGALKGDFAKIVRRVNAMLDAVITPLNVAAEYVERLAGGTLPAKITDEYPGDFNEIKNSLNRCLDAFANLMAETGNMAEAAARGEWGRRGDVSKYEGGWAVIVNGLNQTVEHLLTPLLELGSVLNRLADGDFSARAAADGQGDYHVLQLTCNSLGEQFQTVQAVIEKLAANALNGRFELRDETCQGKGAFAEMSRGLHDLSAAVRSPLDAIMECLRNLAQGALPEKLTGQYKGVFQILRNDSNTLLETWADATHFAEQMALGQFPGTLKERSAQDVLAHALNSVQGTIRNVLRETHTQIQAVQHGRLDVRGNADALPGSWRDLVNDLNRVVEAFAFPVQSVTVHLERLAQGDLPEKLTGEYPGEFDKLRTTVNTMIDETQAVIRLAQEIANGNHNVTVAERSDRDVLRQTFEKLVSALRNGHGGAAKPELPPLEKGAEIMLPGLDSNVMPGSDQDAVSHSLHQMMSNFQTMMGEMEKSVTEVRQQTWLRSGQNELGRILRKEQDAAALAKELLAFLVKSVQAQVGAMYLAQPEHDPVTLRLASSYAYHQRKAHKVEFTLGEGLVGQAALEQESILFANLPEDYMWVTSGLGKTPLRYLLVTPLLYGGELQGAIELGTVHEFSELQLSFLEHVREHIALALHASQTRAQMRKPLETLQRQTAELHEQQAQLQARAAAVEEQARLLQEAEQAIRQQQAQCERAQAELAAQARTLQENEDKLQQQQTLLQRNQAELQSRTWALREAKQAFRQQQEQFSARQAALEAQAGKFRAAAQTLRQQQNECRRRQEELEAQARRLRECEQKLLRQRDQCPQPAAESARRGKELEKQRETMKVTETALDKAHPVRMLIVEHDGLTLMSMVELLSGRGVELTTVETGRDACQRLRTMRFDGLILDLNLTDMTGVELLDMIEADAQIAPLPIIVYADREFTSAEQQLCQRYPQSVRLIAVNSPEQLLAAIPLLLQPAAPDVPAPPPPLRTFPGKDTVLDQKTILMVDAGRKQDSLAAVLQEKGLHILQAGDGEQVLQQLAAHPDVDLVLMDVMLPKMSGCDVTRKIRQEPRFMKLPIIVLTGKARDDDRQQCLAAGVNDYLAKPVDTDELLSLLRAWLY